jgi:hypothetical protein
VERRAGSRCAALFDERSGSGGPGSREGRPQGRPAPGATERVRGRPARLWDGRKPRPRRRAARSSARGARYRAARDPRLGEGCEPGWPKRKERRQAPLHSSLTRGSRTKPRVLVVAGWFAEVEETHLSRERGGQLQGFPRRRGVARWFGPTPSRRRRGKDPPGKRVRGKRVRPTSERTRPIGQVAGWGSNPVRPRGRDRVDRTCPGPDPSRRSKPAKAGKALAARVSRA